MLILKRCAAFLLFGLVGCHENTERLVVVHGAAEQGFCGISPLRTDALDHPSKHAWDLFIVLNHPAKPKTSGRGEPDCSKRIGEPGTTAVWETWRNAGSEVYLADGSEPPVWSDTSLPDELPGSVPSAKDAEGNKIISFHSFVKPANGMRPQFSPDGIFDGAGGFGETRLNKVTYEFIKSECLFSADGQKRYAAAISAGKKGALSFPVDSVEAKAAWLDFVGMNIPKEKWGTYYTADYKGKKYGLVALHIITKDNPDWFWASFHHKDTPDNPFERGDDYGRPKELNGTIWENYKLGGTQTDFVDPNGTPSRLSDHYVEFGFQRSSCITCHATASMSVTGSMPAAQQKAICAMTPDSPAVPLTACRKFLGNDAFKPGTNTLVAERGAPDPAWFQKDGKDHYLQTDFVFSIPFRGQPEKQAPPARCIW